MNKFPGAAVIYRAFLASMWMSLLYFPIMVVVNDQVKTVRWIFLGQVRNPPLPAIQEAVTSVEFFVYTPYWAVEFILSFALALTLFVALWRWRQS